MYIPQCKSEVNPHLLITLISEGKATKLFNSLFIPISQMYIFSVRLLFPGFLMSLSENFQVLQLLISVLPSLEYLWNDLQCCIFLLWGFPSGSVVKKLPANSRDTGLIPGSEDLLGWKWQPIRIFLPGNPLNRGAWWFTVHSVTKNQTWLSSSTFSFYSLYL